MEVCFQGTTGCGNVLYIMLPGFIFFYNFYGFCHGFDISYWMMIWKKLCATDPWSQKSSTWLGLGFAKCSHQAHSRVAVQWDHQGCQGSQSCSHHFVMSYSTLFLRGPEQPQGLTVKGSSDVVTCSRSPVQVFFPSGLCTLMYFCKEKKIEWVEMHALLFVRHLDSECQVLPLKNDVEVCDGLCGCSTADSVFSTSQSWLLRTLQMWQSIWCSACAVISSTSNLKASESPELLSTCATLRHQKVSKGCSGGSGSMFVACTCSPWAG